MPDIIEITRFTTGRPGVVGQLISVFALVDGVPKRLARDEWAALVERPGSRLYHTLRPNCMPTPSEQSQILAAGPVYVAPSMEH